LTIKIPKAKNFRRGGYCERITWKLFYMNNYAHKSKRGKKSKKSPYRGGGVRIGRTAELQK